MEQTNNMGRYSWLILFAISCVMFLPWLGETLFNTKGEPREAIVAVSILETGNWILPVNFGTDIPYKPPFLAWCIAFFSMLFGGEVTEYTSRLPSALATIAMVMSLYGWLRRERKSKAVALVSGLVLVTNIEVWRAASACRVDMVLTAFMFGALLSLYNYFERGGWKWLAVGVLTMTCAFLTKGPIGMLLPCGCGGLYCILRQRRFWKPFFVLVVAAVFSCAVPALWYTEAYNQGGQTFYDLVLEENFGRFTGTMSYASHENPFWYNFQTVLLGMLPYTIVGLISLFVIRWRSAVENNCRSLKGFLENLWKRFSSLTSGEYYTVVVTVLIFVFYCIPKSKRSVYLLPIYPFLAYYVVELSYFVIRRKPAAYGLFSRIIGGLGVIVPVVFFAACLIPLPDRLTAKIGYNAVLLEGLHHSAISIVGVLVILVSLVVSIWLLRGINKNRAGKDLVTLTSLCIATILTSLTAAILPVILSAKSDKPIAEDIRDICPKGKLYMYVDEPMLRYYTANFYLKDRFKLFEINNEEEGLLLTGEFDLPSLHEKFGGSYNFETVKTWNKRSCDTKQPMVLLKFKNKD